MKRVRRLWKLYPVCSMLGLAILMGSVCMFCVDLLPTEGADNNATAARALSTGAIGSVKVTRKIDPADVAGSQACLKCHKSELDALMKSKHHESLKKIEGGGGNIPKYAKAVGINIADVTTDSICSRCHGTPQGAPGNVRAAAGVSCESCHGGSKRGNWLELHAKEVKTDDARKQRDAECDKAGLIRAENLYAISKNCFQCHVISHEALVNGGHPSFHYKGFELVGGSSGEVRHNFQQDQKVNAEAPSLWAKVNKGAAQDRRRMKFVVGILVDLEVRLNNLAAVSKGNGKKPFAKDNAKRLKAAKKDVDKIVKALGNDVPKELEEAQKAIDEMGRVSSFNFKKQAQAKKAAPVIAQAAQLFDQNHDGSKLKALDKLFGKVKPRGTAHSP